jgi:hypothetical protein
MTTLFSVSFNVSFNGTHIVYYKMVTGKCFVLIYVCINNDVMNITRFNKK